MHTPDVTTVIPPSAAWQTFSTPGMNSSESILSTLFQMKAHMPTLGGIRSATSHVFTEVSSKAAPYLTKYLNTTFLATTTWSWLTRKFVPVLDPAGWSDKIENENIKRALLLNKIAHLSSSIALQKSEINALAPTREFIMLQAVEEAQKKLKKLETSDPILSSEVAAQKNKIAKLLEDPEYKKLLAAKTKREASIQQAIVAKQNLEETERAHQNLTLKISSQESMIQSLDPKTQTDKIRQGQENLARLRSECVQMDAAIHEQTALVRDLTKDSKFKRLVQLSERLQELENECHETKAILNTTDEVIEYLNKIKNLIKITHFNTWISSGMNATCPGAGLPASLVLTTISLAAQEYLTKDLAAKHLAGSASKKERSNTDNRIRLAIAGTAAAVTFATIKYFW